MNDFREISVYFDSCHKLIGVPCGKNPRVENSLLMLDTFFVLEPGYNDDELETFFSKVFDACFSKVSSYDEPTAIQKYTKAKSETAAVKKYKLIAINWTKDKGYEIMPCQAWKEYKGSFTSIKGISIKISLRSKVNPIEKGALALAFRTAMGIVEQVDTR